MRSSNMVFMIGLTIFGLTIFSKIKSLTFLRGSCSKILKSQFLGEITDFLD